MTEVLANPVRIFAAKIDQKKTIGNRILIVQYISSNDQDQSSPIGTSSSRYLTNFTRISVLSSPRSTSDINSARTCN